MALTGTGTTAAFALPILQRLAAEGLGRAEEGTALALALVPTRELAMQVAEAVHRYGRVLGARVLPVYCDHRRRPAGPERVAVMLRP